MKSRELAVTLPLTLYMVYSLAFIFQFSDPSPHKLTRTFVFMLAAIPHTVNYLGHDFSLVDYEGPDLFKPREYGINPINDSPGLWRGYLASYAIEGENFLMKGLTVPKIEFNHYPDIGGVHAEKGHYKLNHKVPFTGVLTIAKSFVRPQHRVHAVESYEAVFDVAIKHGTVLCIIDVADKMELAKQLAEANVPNPDESEHLYLVPSDTDPLTCWQTGHCLWARDIEGEWPQKRPALNILLEEIEANVTADERALYLKLPETSAQVKLEMAVRDNFLSPLKKEQFEELVLELLEDGTRKPVKIIPSRYWNVELVARVIVTELGRRINRKANGLMLVHGS